MLPVHAPFAADIGDIPWPDDPVLQRIATRAGLVCFHRFPYLMLRYGLRGEAFSVADCGYLAGDLRALNEPAAVAQGEWLAGLLGHRGMPGWLLERKLAILIRLFARAGLAPGALPAVRAHLAARRAGVLDDGKLELAGWRFAFRLDSFGLLPTRAVRENGMLIAAALADEAVGVASARHLLDWLSDPDRFGALWCGAVGALAADLRGAL